MCTSVRLWEEESDGGVDADCKEEGAVVVLVDVMTEDDVAVMLEDVDASSGDDDDASTSARTGVKTKATTAAKKRPMIANNGVSVMSLFIASFRNTSTIACPKRARYRFNDELWIFSSIE
jgi:hypothetical protein